MKLLTDAIVDCDNFITWRLTCTWHIDSVNDTLREIQHVLRLVDHGTGKASPQQEFSLLLSVDKDLQTLWSPLC